MSNLLTKKNISLIAMIISSLTSLFGLLTLFGAMGGDTGYANSSILYDSGLTKFGADFYTYVNNNAAEAAMAARTVASNLDSIADLMKSVCGIFFIVFGLLSLCYFTMIWIKENEKAAAPVCEAPIAPQANVEVAENVVTETAVEPSVATEEVTTEEASAE